MLRRESYNTMNDGMTGAVVGAANHAPGQLVSPMEEPEELDTSSRPRLTQEQIAILEDQFKGKPKPGTEFKKQLASQIGLSLQRVNNWYQNRRAKARHQRPQERRFDVLPPDPNAPWSTSSVGFPDFHRGQDQFRDLALSHQIPSGDFMAIPSDDLAELTKPLDLEMIHAVLDPTRSSGGTDPMENGLENTTANADPQTSPSVNGLADSKSSFSLMQEWDAHLNKWITDPQVDLSLHHEQFMGIPDSFNPYPHPMYPSSVDGFSGDNPSCQTFGTNSSSDGEPGLMTPPPKTSPMPSLPSSDSQLRRGSNSSELASGLNTIRLHQPLPRQGVYEDMFCPPPTPSLAAGVDHSPRVAPPLPGTMGSPSTLSLNSGAIKVSALPQIDLASRRKRPRPATLRPEPHRSQSYAGPLTMSPTTKVASFGLGPSPSVRRVKSTGQNMNVVNGGRVSKSGVASAQMSPRNFQPYLAAAGLSQSHVPNRQNADASQASASTLTPLTPLSPVKMELQPEVWPDYSPYVGPSAPGWDNSHDLATSHVYEAGADVASPPITPFNMEAFPRFFAGRSLQDSLYHCPQSAPPQQTTFFGDSPPNPAVSINQPNWLVPSSTMPLEGYRDDSPMSMRRPSYLSQTGYPEPPLQFVGNYPRGVPFMGQLSSNYLGSSPPPRKDLEIQVNLIPKPQGAPQVPKKYTFDHKTPKDFSQSVYT
ncbi:hypothetical protein MMC07_008398 [Pseudocyphellaria aurata]|nr:hypothetical protein [Pseudocyphellaria aurata]